MLKKYFKNLYHRTMTEAYALAHQEIINSVKQGGKCLDCGASEGQKYILLKKETDIQPEEYHGIEWSQPLINVARSKNINIIHGDLNKPLPFNNNEFNTIFGLSVLEHLLFPCRYITECYRTLSDDGTLILLTPNISTFFTAALILLGKMPSSGPHPDSEMLLKQEELFKVSADNMQSDADSDTPSHRHLVVFSYRVLKSYLELAGFKSVKGYGFGLYPLPNFMQPPLEKIDPYHCHQMVFVAKK